MVHQQQAAATLGDLADVDLVVPGSDRELLDRARREVGHGHGQAAGVGRHFDVEFGAGVHHRVRGEFRGQQQRLVEQAIEPGLLQHRPDQGPGRGGGTPVVGQAYAAHQSARRLPGLDRASLHRHACILSCRRVYAQSRLSQ
jgi:hypothetical protein